MTDAGWAEKAVAKRLSDGWSGDAWVMGPGEAADMLRKEHARSVRIVKRIGKQDVLKRFDHKTCEYAEGYLKACLDILTALQRGRGGKG